eukprot:313854-Rhodomonas_salina.6
MPGTEIAFICLRTCYAMPGTDIACWARPRSAHSLRRDTPSASQARYHLSCTGFNGGVRCPGPKPHRVVPLCGTQTTLAVQMLDTGK